jgi:Bacterial protein of unknown function (DUF899)/Protein of unknown function (DUF1579)
MGPKTMNDVVTGTIPAPRVVSREEWLDARKTLLAKEKGLTRLRDQLAAERRALPWVRVEKQYVFDGPQGPVTPVHAPRRRSAKREGGGRPMTTISRSMMVAAAAFNLALVAFAQSPGYAQQGSPAGPQTVPAWVQRGIPSAGHAALVPLVGSWRVEQSVYATMGRSPDLPPIVSHDIRTTRVWVADGQYIEDTTEGTVEGQPYWRRGWLGYSNLDRRYEWVTIAPRVPMMIYLGRPGSGEHTPIEVTGVFTDQGVVSEQTVGKPIVQRTVIRIEHHDRHVFELYFTPPGGKEQLALRSVYTRIK